MITGYYGCTCHPFKSWEESDAAHRQKFKIGDKVENRHSGLEGIVDSVSTFKGFVVVKYGKNESDKHSDHVARLIPVK